MKLGRTLLRKYLTQEQYYYKELCFSVQKHVNSVQTVGYPCSGYTPTTFTRDRYDVPGHHVLWSLKQWRNEDNSASALVSHLHLAWPP
jgi:hypothetical protein